MQRVGELVQTIESSADPNIRTAALELIQTLMDFHGAGIGRMMDITANAGAAGYAIFDDLAGDDLASSLLMLYDLHPLDIETRITQALERVRPTLSLHKGDVELVRVNSGVVTLRLKGSCEGCPSSALTLRHTIEETIYAAAPDVLSIEVEVAPERPDPGGLVQIGRINTAEYTDCEFTAAA